MNMTKKGLFIKICAMVIVITLTISDFLFVGQAAVSYAVDIIKTNSANVDFSVYFINASGDKVEKLEENIDKGEEYLYVDISVKNEGYFNGKISLNNNNFNIKNMILSESVAEISGNEVRLNQINAGSTVTIKLAIDPINSTSINSNMLNSVTKVSLNGQYINSKNVEKEKHIDISGTAEVSINWKSSENTKLELESSLLTNSIYSNNNEENRVVQILVNSKITNNNYPVKNTNIILSVPENVKDVIVHSRSNAATNSSVIFSNANYIYNKEEKKLTITVANQDTNSISWAKNVQDSFVITYILEKEDSLLNSEISVIGEVSTYDNKNLSSTNSVHIDKEIDGIVSFELDTNENYIYKGRLYTGEERSYKTISKVYIDYLNANKITLNEGISSFASSDATIPANIVYKQIRINKNEFLAIFGNDGYITIKDNDGTIISNINANSQTDAEGNVVVNISEGINALSMETTKPVAIGTLNIENTKSILSTGYSREIVSGLSAINENLDGRYDEKQINSLNKNIELRNTSSKASLAISTNTLSSIEENKQVKITAVLLNNDESKDLYQNPNIKISLPQQVKALNNVNCKVLYANGLEAKANIGEENGNKIITINLSGTQQTYNTETLEGTTIIIYADLLVDQLATNSDENIILNYTNEIASSFEDNGEVKAPVKIVAEQGLITTNIIPELNVETIGNKGTKNVVLPTNKEANNATVKIGLINNEGVVLNNISILGKFPTSANLGASLATKINVLSENNIKVYYSENENANEDIANVSNGWTEQLNTVNPKKYLITVPNMAIGEKFEATYNINIPENLGYNLQAEEGYKVNYTNSVTFANKQIDATTLNLTTGTGAELQSTIKAYIAGEEITDGSTVYNGEIIKYVVTVKNNGTEAAKNVNIKTEVPEKTTYVQYIKTSDNLDPDEMGSTDYYKEVAVENGVISENIESLGIGEEKKFSYEIRIEDEAINNTISTKSTVTYLGNATKEDADTINSNSITNRVSKSDIAMNMVMIVRGSDTIKKGLVYAYNLTVTNKSDSKLSNVEVEVKPNSLYTISNLVCGEDIIEFNNNKFTIESINPGETKTYEIDVNANGEGEIATIYAIANNLYHSNFITERVATYRLTASMKSSNEGETINNGDSILYNINVTNDGTENIDYIEVSQDISTHLDIKRVTANGKEIEYSTQFKEDEQENTEAESQENEANTTNKVEESEKYKLGFFTEDKLKSGESMQINVEASTSEEDSHSNDIHLSSLAEVRIKNLSVQTEEINHILKANLVSIEEDQPELIENPEGEDEPADPNEPNNPNNPDNPSGSDSSENPSTPEDQSGNNKQEKTYTVSGTAWLDSNENGSRDSEEQTLSGIKVRLLNLDNNTSINSTTSENGFYSISNVKNGRYVAIFDYDTEKYMLTTYQAENVSSSRNSDIENVTMNLDGESKKVASTDTITINNENITNIDIGLIEAKVFDLSLTKTISKVTITNSTGAKTTEYNDANIAKVEIKAKNLEGTLVAIEYKVKVTNNGEVAGYIKQIVDYKPSDLSFNSSLNPEWYQSGDYIYSASLANTRIEAGETKELTLVLTKKMTESNTGLTNNTAEIAEDYNSYGIQDIDSTPGNKQTNEDDMGSSNVIISVSTGAAVSYISLTLSIIILIAVGTYIVSRKILKDNIEI